MLQIAFTFAQATHDIGFRVQLYADADAGLQSRLPLLLYTVLVTTRDIRLSEALVRCSRVGYVSILVVCPSDTVLYCTDTPVLVVVVVPCI